MHIYKYGQSCVIILHQYVSLTLVTVVKVDTLIMVHSPSRAALSTAERAASSVAVQQLMSSALRALSTENCRANGFISRCAAINVVRSPARATLSTAERAASSVAVQQLMSSALRARSTTAERAASSVAIQHHDYERYPL